MSELYNVLNEPEMRDPALILALSGWVDAGTAGTAAAEFLASGSEEIVRFDGDSIFDYRANRPVVRFRGGRMTEVDWPSVAIHHCPLPERDLLVMVGSEPDFRWREFAEATADLMERFGAELIITIGAIPAAVPHTYPPPVMMTASTDALVGGDDVALDDDLDVPGAAVNVVADAAVRRGMGTLGYWAQIPHYVNEEYHAGSLALLQRIALRLDLNLDLSDVVAARNEQAEKINEAIADRPESRAHIEKLEMLAEEGRLASGDDIAAQIEDFLRES
ncbi:MAG: PAC2 family protein [Acidimicrobiia bacterium]|nr:PAC2 family protein [Acidimicrobiia bacterium]